MDDITVINDAPETPQRPSRATTTTELPTLSTDQLTPARTHTPVKILTPPRPTETQDTVDIPIGHPTGEQEPWMGPVRFGPATRGDMELLSLYLTTPRSTKGSQVNTPLGNQFITKNVSGVMDTFYRTLQEAIFIPLHETDDPSMFLMTEDWMSQLGDSERLLLESVKRFILHTAIYCARGAPTNFAFPRTNEKGDLEASRKDRVDCLKDFVTDVIVLTKWLKDSCETPEGEPLPSLKEFIQKRISKLDSLAKEGKRDKRRYFFRPNALRSTHEYCRKACCVILGLVDDYDQFPEYGLADWDKRVLVFDNIEHLIWKGFGLKFKTDRQELKGLTGSIVDLDANFIATGPFMFVKTRRVQEHLTLSKEREIRIYSSPVLGITAYMFQAHSIGQSAGISHLGLEIARSYALLFLQSSTPRTKHLASTVLPYSLSRVSLSRRLQPYDFKTTFYDSLHWGNIPRLEDFVLFRPRLYELQREMNDWRPQRARDLLTRGYKDPLTWWGFIFAVVVGVIGVLSLAVSVIQTLKAFFPSPAP